jgi:hypothetical protein
MERFKTKRKKNSIKPEGAVKVGNEHPTYADNPLYESCKDKLDLDHVDDVSKWANKSNSMNDGKTTWQNPDVSTIMKSCGHEMGSGCGCPSSYS